MKLAWLCWDQFGDCTVLFTEPDSRCHGFARVQCIVYAEIQEN